MGLKMHQVCDITGFNILCSKGLEYCKKCGQQDTPLEVSSVGGIKK